MTKAQYEKIRQDEKAKKEANYQRNVAKAGKFIDFTDWYAKRGTELSQGWRKTVTLGHTMAKTKYDWSGTEQKKDFESFSNTDKFMSQFKSKPVAKKTVAKKVAAKPVAKKAAVKPAAKKGPIKIKSLF